MRKILIDEDVLKALIDSASFEARDFRLYQGYGDFSDRVYAQIAKAEKAIEEAKQNRFSLIEWHKMDEVPEDSAEILLRFDSGRIGCNTAFVLSDTRWQLHVAVKEFPVAWAYMPECDK